MEPEKDRVADQDYLFRKMAKLNADMVCVIPKLLLPLLHFYSIELFI